MSIDDTIQKLEDRGIRNILIVDDKSENLSAASSYFSSIGIEYEECNSATSAIKKLNEKTYDLVITDLQMETPNAGEEVIKEAGAHFTHSYILTGGTDHGKDNVLILPIGHYIRGSKKDDGIWAEIFETILGNHKKSQEYLKVKQIFTLIREYHGKKRSEKMGELVLEYFKPVIEQYKTL